MASLQNITLPTPEPYSKNDPSRNQENYFYVYLQLLQVAKTAGETVSFNPAASLTVDLTDLVEAVKDLKFNGQEIDLGPMRIVFEGQTVSTV